MKKSKISAEDASRSGIYKWLKQRQIKSRRIFSKQDIQELIQELQVPQLDLRVQNKDLQRTHFTLQESRDKYHDLYEWAPVGFFTFDEQGFILEVNRTGAALLNTTPEALIGERFDVFVTSDSQAEFYFFCRQVLSAGVKQACDLKLLSIPPKQTYVRIEGMAVDDKGKEGRQIRATVLDITENKILWMSLRWAYEESELRVKERTEELTAANEELAAEKQRLAVTLSSIGDGVITTDLDGKTVLINKVAEQLTGWTEKEAVGRLLSEVFQLVHWKTGACCESPVVRALRTGGAVGLSHPTLLMARDGRELIIDDSCAPIRGKEGEMIGVVLVFRDVTNRLKMEEEHLRMSKLDALGLLAGGIAHDFNNLLTAILGNISLTLEMAGPNELLVKRLEAAQSASLRARDLSKQLLTFAKGGAPIKNSISISELLTEATLFALGGSNIRCDFALPKGLWAVKVDEGQISQVIHNLALNAQQAMPEGGILRIEAENWKEMSGFKGTFPLQRGHYVKISVQDSGVGIPKKNLRRIFDPYFTTKEKGSGLGLSTAYSIIKKHDGWITVESEKGKGTTFILFLPTSPGVVPTPKKSERRPMIDRRGKILIMDDEEIILEVTARLISHLGYQADTTRDGTEAVEYYRLAKEGGRPYDAVIMDLTVPGGVGGKEAIRKLIAIDSRVKAIVSSGYSNDEVMANYTKYGFRGVVVKPFKLEELSHVLDQVVSQG